MCECIVTKDFSERDMNLEPILAFFSALALLSVSEGTSVPGKGCGIESPFQLVSEITDEMSLDDLECVIVQDKKSFQKKIKQRTPGMADNLIKPPSLR